MIRNLSAQASIVQQYLLELRDGHRQHDPARFARNLERVGELAAYELSRQLRYRPAVVRTPVGEATGRLLDERLVVAGVLRAGLPLQSGILRVFDNAESAFITAYRHDRPRPSGPAVSVGYVATPPLEGKTLILADTMVATGRTVIMAYRRLLRQAGRPRRCFLVAAIISEVALVRLERLLPELGIVAGPVDPTLTDDFLISPGLGDAGDLLYGPKLAAGRV